LGITFLGARVESAVGNIAAVTQFGTNTASFSYAGGAAQSISFTGSVANAVDLSRYNYVLFVRVNSPQIVMTAVEVNYKSILSEDFSQ
jgi:hypothetical protein